MAASKGFCGHCGEAPTLTCKDCENMQYCTTECQQADSDIHTLLCKQYDAFKTRPGPNFRRTILLPADGSEPKFVWIEIEGDVEIEDIDTDDLKTGLVKGFDVSRDDPVEGVTIPQFSHLFDGSEGDEQLVLGKRCHGERLNHSIRMHCDDDYMYKFKSPQPCFKRMLDLPVAARVKGPLVFYGGSKAMSFTRIKDLDTRDLTLALHGVVRLFHKTTVGMSYTKKPIKVAGVKVNAGKGVLTDVKIPTKHPIFKSGKVSEISKSLAPALPVLKLWQTPDMNIAAKDASTKSPLTSYLAMSMKEQLGTIPLEWLDNRNTVLIAAADGAGFYSKVATPANTIKATCAFFRDTIQPSIKDELRKKLVKGEESNANGPPQWEKLTSEWACDIQAAHKFDLKSGIDEASLLDPTEKAEQDYAKELREMFAAKLGIPIANFSYQL